MTQKFRGVWTAIATPFLEDGSIDWKSWETLLAKQNDAQVTGVVVSGTTGEAPTLSVQEKISLVRKARAVLDRSIRVMAGSGGNNTEQSIELSKLCLDGGADSLLIVTPPYNKPSPAGLKLHFSKIAEATRAPICLYHVPGRTAQSLSVETMAMLCSIPHVDAVKEASGDIAFWSRSLLRTGKAFLSGDDPTYLASLATGGDGVISVVSNIFPAEMVALTKAWFAGKPELALRWHNALLAAIDCLFCEVNPSPLKAALAHMGLAKNVLRAPLAPVTDANFKLIAETIEAAKLKFSQIPKS
jgi:4-hydroxy-tetrahydrodipicolinate synthase